MSSKDQVIGIHKIVNISFIPYFIWFLFDFYPKHLAQGLPYNILSKYYSLD